MKEAGWLFEISKEKYWLTNHSISLIWSDLISGALR